MNIPKKLKIGGHQFRVELVEGNNLDEDNTCGKCDKNKNTILISKSLSQSQKEVTLFHEIIHAVNGELEEEIVDSLAEQLYQVLSANNLLK